MFFRARYQCIAGTFRKRNIGTSERICFYNGTLSGSEIECIPGIFNIMTLALCLII